MSVFDRHETIVSSAVWESFPAAAVRSIRIDRPPWKAPKPPVYVAPMSGPDEARAAAPYFSVPDLNAPPQTSSALPAHLQVQWDD